MIPPEDVVKKGIPYIKTKLVVGDKAKQFDEFWAYFIETWCDGRYKITDWNIYALLGKEEEGELINRTNNALERYNRVLKSKFRAPHPGMVDFIEVIKKLQVDEFTELQNIKRGVSVPPMHEDVYKPSIPYDYYCFTPPKLAKKSKKVRTID